MSTTAEVRNALDVLRKYYSDRDGRPAALNEIQLACYVDALRPLDPDALEAVVRAHIRSSPFFPKVADLLAHLGPDPKTAATIAWAVVENAVQRGGSYRAVRFENGQIGEAVQLTFGNWPRACAFGFDSPGWAIRRQTFLAVFGTLKPSAPLTLLGLHGTADDPYVVAPVAGLLTSTDAPRGELTDGDARDLLAEVERRAQHREQPRGKTGSALPFSRRQ